MFESSNFFSSLIFSFNNNLHKFFERFGPIGRKDVSPFTYKYFKDTMDRQDVYLKEMLINIKKKQAMLDLWKEQSLTQKICIKKRWQSLFPKLSKFLIQKGCIKRIKTLVNTELIIIRRKLKHITQIKISPEKIAQWKAETAHVQALVEEKITLVKQVMKWKDIAGEFHDKNCETDDWGCCQKDQANFDNCHPDCEYQKFYFISD
jgi:hypothetical protein